MPDNKPSPSRNRPAVDMPCLCFFLGDFIESEMDCSVTEVTDDPDDLAKNYRLTLYCDAVIVNGRNLQDAASGDSSC